MKAYELEMKKYVVSIWASVIVEAQDESHARDKAYDMFNDGEIKNREFEFDATELQVNKRQKGDN